MDYGKIIKRSWGLTFKNKWLWVYGLVLAMMGGGGGSYGNSFSNVFENKDKQKAPILPSDLPEQTSEVLGQTAAVITDWAKSVPIGVWFAGIIGLVVIFVLAIAISWIMQTWATGSLIAGLWDADEEKKVTLASTSGRGVKSIKRLILLGIISFLMTLGGILVFSLIIGFGMLGFSFMPSPAKEILMVLWGMIAVLTLLVLMFLMGMVGIWAERLIVLKNYSPWRSWQSGFSLSFKHFWNVVVMGIVNMGVGCAIGCLSMMVILLVLGIPAGIIIASMFKGGFHMPGAGSIAGLVVLFALLVCLNLAVRVVLVVFNYGNWNLFFKEIMKNGGDSKNAE